MKFFATAVSAAFFSVAALAQQNGITINSLESVTVCRPSLITWSGGTPPYFLVILPAGQPSAQPLVDFGKQSGNSVTWLVNLPVGTSGFLNLRDNTGAIGQSASFTILTNSDTSCLSKSLSVSSGPATATGANSPTGATATSTGASKTSTSTGAATATRSAAAAASQFNIGAAAVLGAAVLAFAA